MAKMFYTIEEVCEKLGKNEDEVKEMVGSGQIQEFRDRDRLMFKVEQIDLLAGGDEESGDVHLDLGDPGGSGLDLQDDSVLGLADSREASSIPLSDSRESSGMGLADSRDPSSASGSGFGLADSAEGTGISVFDTDHGGEEESEQTHVGGEALGDELNLEAVGSGSGLLDLTRESDDTSLGAELLEEVYSSDDNVEIPANASGLFEAASEEAAIDETMPVSAGGMAAPSGGATVPMVMEAYDGAGSGLGAGMMLGALAALVCVAVIAIVGVSGATPGLATTIAGNIWMWAGGLLGLTIILGVVGLFIGKASE